MKFNVEIELTSEMAEELKGMSKEVKKEVYDRVLGEIHEVLNSDIGDGETTFKVTYPVEELS